MALNKEEKKKTRSQLLETWAGIGIFSAIWAATFGVVTVIF
ncbi:MAG: hypothetical protein R3321_01095 [Nitrososphaeraceae archaeon]|nr:hypothetical protein [Nitrososphaeraceae archaeon]